jgi:hypothetical protein
MTYITVNTSIGPVGEDESFLFDNSIIYTQEESLTLAQQIDQARQQQQQPPNIEIIEVFLSDIMNEP